MVHRWTVQAPISLLKSQSCLLSVLTVAILEGFSTRGRLASRWDSLWYRTSSYIAGLMVPVSGALNSGSASQIFLNHARAGRTSPIITLHAPHVKSNWASFPWTSTLLWNKNVSQSVPVSLILNQGVTANCSIWSPDPTDFLLQQIYLCPHYVTRHVHGTSSLDCPTPRISRT